MDSSNPSSSSLKRASSELQDSSESLTTTELVVNTAPTRWPKFLLVSGTDDSLPLRSINAVVIAKSISGQIGSDDFEVTRLRSGDLLVKVSTEAHSRSLFFLSAIHFHGIAYPVTVHPHQSLNSSKGVARCQEFKLFSEEEIVVALSSQGVIEAKRLSFMKDGERHPSGTVFLTFGFPDVPERIKLGFMVVRVDPYVPNPMRCFNCQKFGHTARTCKHEQACSVCSGKGHDDRSCINQAKCANCEGDHPSFSKECPLYRQEKQVQEVKVKQKLSYFEAKKLVLGNSLPLFSSVVVKSTVSVTVSTQTDPADSHCHCGPSTVCFAGASASAEPIVQPSRVESTVQKETTVQTIRTVQTKASKLPSPNQASKIARPSSNDKPALSQAKSSRNEQMDTSKPPSKPGTDSKARTMKPPDRKKPKPT
jgi:hypothetical protein